MLFTLKLPVTDKQYQLLNIMVGPSPFKATSKNLVGKMILNNFRGNTGIKPHNSNKYQGKYYEIVIPAKWVERYGIQFISDESLADFLEYLKKEFEHRMFCAIDGVLEFKQKHNRQWKQKLRGKATADKKLVAKMKDAALSFLYKYNLNEDFMNFDTIKKAYQRHEGQPSAIGIAM